VAVILIEGFMRGLLETRISWTKYHGLKARDGLKALISTSPTLPLSSHELRD
jgi:hypothetical protein